MRWNSALCQLGVDSISDKINCIHNQIYHIFSQLVWKRKNQTTTIHAYTHARKKKKNRQNETKRNEREIIIREMFTIDIRNELMLSALVFVQNRGNIKFSRL